MVLRGKAEPGVASAGGRALASSRINGWKEERVGNGEVEEKEGSTENFERERKSRHETKGHSDPTPKSRKHRTKRRITEEMRDDVPTTQKSLGVVLLDIRVLLEERVALFEGVGVLVVPGGVRGH